MAPLNPAVTALALATSAISLSTAPFPGDDEFQYIDNGVVRLGVDLTRGGSIGFWGPSGSDTNLINCHDMVLLNPPHQTTHPLTHLPTTSLRGAKFS